MDTLFGLTREKVMDSNRLKFIDGIAGCGKTTSVIDFLGEHPFKFFGPTNRNVQSTAQRFGIKTETTASGLFKTVGGVYYAEEKPMEGETIIIDELLLTSPRIWDYIAHNRNNYILLTDTRQMLPPKCDTIKKAAQELEKHLFDYVKLATTKRAINQKTIDEYNRAYKIAAKDGVYDIKSDILGNRYNVITAKELEYSPADTYITHMNAQEQRLYKRFRDAFIEKTPKALAAKETDGEKIDALPYLCQKDAEKMHARKYAQVANIATPTRFQGCETGGDVYYIIGKNSRITTREYYTTITRAKDLERFTIVIDEEEEDKMVYFMGKTVKKEVTLKCDSEEEANELTIANKNNSSIFHYSEKVKIKGHDTLYHTALKKYDKKKEPGKRGLKCKTLITQEDGINFGVAGMTEVYRILEKHGLDHINRPLMKSFGDTHECTHNIDLYSAFPHFLYYNRFPVDSVLEKKYNPDNMNFFLYTGNYLSKNCLVIDEVYNLFSPEVQKRDFVFLFGTHWKQGTSMGKKTLEKSLRSIDAKEQVKKIRWGLLSSAFLKKKSEKYLRKVDTGKKLPNGKPVTKLEIARRDIYIKDDSATYELFGIALYSHALALMLSLCKTGQIETCYTVIDGLFYKGDADIDKILIDYIEKSPYRARLYHGHYEGKKYIKDCIQWKNYRELTKKSIKVSL